MKVFVSGQIRDTAFVQSVQRALEQAGHQITHDWVINEASANNFIEDKSTPEAQAESAHRAQLDLQGVLAADAHVVCTNNQVAGKGMYVELGAALAAQQLQGRPKIYLLGAANHPTIFYYHPAVQPVATIDELIERLAE